jgi:hypothetical protein
MTLTRFQNPLNQPHDEDWQDRRDAARADSGQDEPRTMPDKFLTIKVVPENSKVDIVFHS